MTPPLGALLIELLPMQWVLAIDVVTAIVAIAPLLFIPIPQPARAGVPEGRPSVLSEMRAGLEFILGWRGLFILVLMAMFVNLLATPSLSLTLLLVTGHFGGGAREYAVLQSAVGLGMVLGGLFLGFWGGFRRQIVTGLLALVLEGVGLIAVGFTPSNAFWAALAGIFFFMFMNPVSNGSMIAVLQATIPPGMQGMVFTLLMSGSAAMTPIGLAFAGPIADLLGVQIWFIAGGIAIVLMGVVSFFVPAIMHLEERQTEGPQQEKVG